MPKKTFEELQNISYARIYCMHLNTWLVCSNIFTYGTRHEDYVKHYKATTESRNKPRLTDEEWKKKNTVVRQKKKDAEKEKERKEKEEEEKKRKEKEEEEEENKKGERAIKGKKRAIGGEKATLNKKAKK